MQGAHTQTGDLIMLCFSPPLSRKESRLNTINPPSQNGKIKHQTTCASSQTSDIYPNTGSPNTRFQSTPWTTEKQDLTRRTNWFVGSQMWGTVKLSQHHPGCWGPLPWRLSDPLAVAATGSCCIMIAKIIRKGRYHNTGGVQRTPCSTWHCGFALIDIHTKRPNHVDAIHIYYQNQLAHRCKSHCTKLHRTPDMFRCEFTPSSGGTNRTLKSHKKISHG
jgi:hypothetical protein